MRLRLIAMLLLALSVAPVANADDLKVIETGPAANAVLDSVSDGFFVLATRRP